MISARVREEAIEFAAGGITFDLTNGYRFELVDMDGRRVDKVLVPRVKPETR